MTDSALRLKEEVLRLSEADRAALADMLLDSLGERTEEEEAAWEAELDRRSQEMKSGRIAGISADEMFAELRRKRS